MFQSLQQVKCCGFSPPQPGSAAHLALVREAANFKLKYGRKKEAISDLEQLWKCVRADEPSVEKLVNRTPLFCSTGRTLKTFTLWLSSSRRTPWWTPIKPNRIPFPAVPVEFCVCDVGRFLSAALQPQ